MVAFGAAPALMAYTWVLKDIQLFGLGWIGAFIYCAGAGIRLARFNANIAVVDKRYFQGLPSPSGAAVLAGFIWVLVDFGFAPREYPWLAWVGWAVAVFAGFTMVSNVPYWSFKEVNWKKRVPLWVILASVVVLSVVASGPSLVLFALIMAYAVSGYVMWAMGHRVRPVLPEE
jgi:CDP-diacylglycerol--serine O-phosphatidyltransferase